jgi:hypothetical protein
MQEYALHPKLAPALGEEWALAAKPNAAVMVMEPAIMMKLVFVMLDFHSIPLPNHASLAALTKQAPIAMVLIYWLVMVASPGLATTAHASAGKDSAAITVISKCQ